MAVRKIFKKRDTNGKRAIILKKSSFSDIPENERTAVTFFVAEVN